MYLLFFYWDFFLRFVVVVINERLFWICFVWYLFLLCCGRRWRPCSSTWSTRTRIWAGGRRSSGWLMAYLSAAINPCIYAGMSDNYKDDFKLLTHRLAGDTSSQNLVISNPQKWINNWIYRSAWYRRPWSNMRKTYKTMVVYYGILREQNMF